MFLEVWLRCLQHGLAGKFAHFPFEGHPWQKRQIRTILAAPSRVFRALAPLYAKAGQPLTTWPS